MEEVATANTMKILNKLKESKLEVKVRKVLLQKGDTKVVTVEEEVVVVIVESMQKDLILSGEIRIMKEQRSSLKAVFKKKDPQESIIKLMRALKVEKDHPISQESFIITTLGETK